MRNLAPTLSIFILFLIGCHTEADRDRSIDFEQIVLRDVEGMHGGRDLWIDANGNVFCRIVEPSWQINHPGMPETRHKVTLTSKQQNHLASLLAENDFFNMQTNDRYGIPGEVYVEAGNHTRGVRKWNSDEHEQFDAIYEYLLKIVEQASESVPSYQGHYDWNWSPKGFADFEMIAENTPNVGSPSESQ